MGFMLGDSGMNNTARIDSYVAGFFMGCVALCFLMLAVPRPLKCEVSVYKKGSQVEVVQVGVLKTY